jgi:hypothetical protein
MDLSSWFRKPHEPPVREWSDEVLGVLLWSDDEDGWVGKHGELAIVLSRGNEARPSESLCAYARECLSDAALLRRSLERAKREAVTEYGSAYAHEIDGLQFGVVNFYEH